MLLSCYIYFFVIWNNIIVNDLIRCGGCLQVQQLQLQLITAQATGGGISSHSQQEVSCATLPDV